MVRGKGTVKRMLTEGEKQDIKGQVQEAQETLREMKKYGSGTPADAISTANLEKKINHYGKVLEDGTPRAVRGARKDGMAERAQELKKQIVDGMPTRNEMDHPAKCPGAVHKHMKWDKRNKEAVREYKNIMRTLEPGDPTATDLEKFRKEK